MIRGLKFFLFTATVLFTLNSHAQDRFYHVYVDTDNNSSSGCDVDLPDFSATIDGADGRLTITTDSNQPPNITSTTYHLCDGSAFDSGTAVAPAALGFNTSINNHDVFEAQIPRAALGINSSGSVIFYYVTDSSSASDIVLTNSGGGPIGLGFTFPVPTLGLLALALLIFGFVFIAHRNINHKLSVMLVLVATSSVAWAMAIVVDGQTDDWNGINPTNTDPTNDTSVPGSFADLTQVYLTEQNDTIFFRMDVVDVENQAPVTNNVSDTTLEDNTVTITVTGSDTEGDALTFDVDTAPTNGTLSAFSVVNSTTATVDYTPDADFNGDDTFTFTANDGQVNSATATADITVTAVNDAPSFTSGGNVNQLKTDGPYNEIWASNISAGATNESAQNLTFNILTNDNTTIFSVQPSLDASGMLSFTGVPDATGTANIAVNLTDDGGTTNAGDDTSATVNFSIILQGVNDEPSFTAGSDQTVLEDAGVQTVAAWATAISAGPADESGQVLTFTVINNDDPALFSAAPQVDANTGDLTFTPAADANGIANISVFLMDDGGTANGGDDTSTTASFNIIVTALNDAPSFTAGPNQSVLEGAGAQTVNNWATDISAGPVDESAQTTSFNVTNNNNTLFSVQPAVDATGNLTYTPDPNELGSATVSVSIADDGGTANGGIDTSAIQTFEISVTLVNDEPSFTVGADQTTDEDAGAISVANWATNVLAGPPDESGQVLTFNITANDNAALFSAGPAVAANGTLSYTPATDANGTANITLELMDDGGTANGGDDTSPPQSFSITVNPVNDAPTFTSGADDSVLEESGAQTVSVWATDISAGPADESAQSISFNFTNNNNALFSVQPAVDAAGNLTYTPAANTSGVATVSVIAEDDGGTANGGVDTSAAQNFTITVTGVNDAPSFTAAANPAATNEDGGAQSQVWASAISAGPADESSQTLTFNLTQTSIDTTLSFSTAPTVNSTTGNVEYTAADNAFGSATYDVVLMDDGGTANGGVDTTSPAVSLTITVNPVNDPPSVTAPGPFPVTTNIRISVPDGANDLLAGATDVETGTTLSIQGTGTISTTQGGTVTANTSTGTFTYDPAPGFTGADTFNYVVCDDGVPAPSACSAAASVTLNVSGNTIWFIDNSAAAGGNGTLQTPFDSMADFNTSTDPGDGDYVYLAAGTYNEAGITLSNNQTLFGQGRTGAFDTVTGITAAPLSVARPTLGGARPTITSSANGINLAQNNTISGLNVRNTIGFGLNGTVVGNLSTAEIAVDSIGGAIRVTTSGAFGNNVSFDVLDSNTNGTSAIDLFGVSGTLAVSSAGAGITNGSANSAVRITSGTLTMDYPGSITNSAGRTLDITNNDGGTLTFSGIIDGDGSGVVFSFNLATTMNLSGGMNLNTGTNGAITALGGGTINITGINDLQATTGTLVDIQNTTIGTSGVTLRSVNKSGGANGIFINNAGTAGFFAITGSGTTNGSGGTIQNTTSNGILIQNTNNITLNNMNLSNAADEAAGCNASTFNSCTASVEFNVVSNITINNMFMDGSDEHGLFAQNISNIDINNSTFSNLGNAASPEHAIFIRELSGTTATANDSVFDGLTLSGSGDTGVLIENVSTTGQVSIQGATSFTSMGEQGVIAETLGAGANLTVNIGNASAVGAGDTVTFSGLGAAAVALNANTGNLTAVVRNSEFNAGATDLPNAIEGTSQAIPGASSLSVMATGNNITIPDGVGTGRGGINFRADGIGNANGVIENNTINSTEVTVFGVLVNNTGVTDETQNSWSIANNTVNLTATGAAATTDGITVEANNPVGTAGVSASISNNNISAAGASGFTGGLELLVGVFNTPVSNTSVLCTSVSNNTISAPNATLGGFTAAGQADVVAASFGDDTRLDVAGLTVGPLTEAQADAGITAANTAGDTTVFPAPAGAYAGVVSCP